jgi:hypothetical protein
VKAPRRLALAALPVLLLPELAYWLGWLATDRPGASGSCAVLVLGYPARADGSPRAMQRRRVDAAVETMRAAGCGAMIISGGDPHGGAVEADVMGMLARNAGVAPEAIVLERAARNTWENVKLTLPELEKHPALYIVSDSLHAHRGKRYLCKQRPDLCSRARAAGFYRFGDLYALKFPGAAHEAVSVVRDALLYR